MCRRLRVKSLHARATLISPTGPCKKNFPTGGASSYGWAEWRSTVTPACGGGSGGGGDEETNMASSLARLNLSSPSTTITPNGGIVSGFEGVQVLNPSLMTQQQPLPLARPLFSPSFLKKSVLQLDFHCQQDF